MACRCSSSSERATKIEFYVPSHELISIILMSDLPVIRSVVIRRGFGDRQGGNIASRWKKMYSEKLF